MRKACWYTGVALDILHIPLALSFLIFPYLWLPDPLPAIVPCIVISLQVLFLGCPLTMATHWLRRRHKPDYNGWVGSITFSLYHHYGRRVGILIFAVCMALSYLVLRATLAAVGG